MEPAAIVTTAILLTLVVGLVVQTAVSLVKKAKKKKKPDKDKRKRPESNKENVVPSSTSFGAPSSASSFVVSSSGQTKVTEESHYQQIKSSVIRSESPVAPPTVLKHETTKTETRTSSGDKLLPLCVEAFHDSVLSPISGISKTKQQEVKQQSSYQQFQSSTIRSGSPQTQFGTQRTGMTETQTKSTAEKLLPVCVEAFQDSVLSPISGIKKTKNQEVTEKSFRQQNYSSVSSSVASPVPHFTAKPSVPGTQVKSSAEKLLPVCVEAFQDSVLSPISGIRKTKTQEVQSSVIRSVTPPVPSPTQRARPAAEKLLPVCVEAFQDSVLSPISGPKTKKQEIQSSVLRSSTPPVPNTVPKPWKSEIQTGSSPATKLLPMCVEAFQDSVLSPISGIGKTKKQEIQSSPIRSVTPPVLCASPKPWKPGNQASPAEKLLPLCVEAFHDSVLSPISGVGKTKKQEVTTTTNVETKKMSSSGEKLLPFCVEAFQDSVLSPISGISKTKHSEPSIPVATTTQEAPAGEKLLPLCVEAFQDSVLSPISGIKKTKNQEIMDQSQETRSTVIRSETPPATQKSETTEAQKLLPVCVEAFRDSVLSPISGISKTKTQEVTQDGCKTEKTTTETIQETKGSCQTTILRKEKESVVRDSFVTGNRPIFQATPLSAMSQPSTVKMTKYETKSSETKQNVWKPTGEVAGKVKGFSSNQMAGVVNNKPVAPATDSVVSRNVYQRSDMESSTLPRRNGYDSGTSSGAFNSPEPPLMPSRPYSSAPTNKPAFQNFNTTAKTWNEAKKTDVSHPTGFKPVRPPTYYK